jgi:hypothetical protein
MSVSLLRGRTCVEARQATLFVDVSGAEGGRGSRFWRGSARCRTDLLPLIGRFLGPRAGREAFWPMPGSAAWERSAAEPGETPTWCITPRPCWPAPSAASARVMVASVVKEEPLGIDEVMNILDEASQVRAYSKQLEQKSRELEAATAELREPPTSG